ncbi:MAG: hypothetical protein WC666_00885 [Candidatus Paceibacterota bacterium]
MKTYDRFAPVFRRVSAPLREAYEISTSTNLKEENRKFVRSEQVIDWVTKLTVGLMLLLLLAPWPLALVIHWTGLINSTFSEITTAVILTCIVVLCFLAYFRKIGFEAIKVRDASEAVLEKFEESVRALEQDKRRLLEERRLFNHETVHENLAAMVQDVLDAEGLEKYLHDSMKTDLVNDIVSIVNHVNETKQLLENALTCQTLFGLNFTRRGLFQEVEAKSK